VHELAVSNSLATLIPTAGVPDMLKRERVLMLIKWGLEKSKSDSSLEELLEKLRNGQSQLWLGHAEGSLDMIFVTGIQAWTPKRRLHVELMAGENFDNYADYLPQIAAFAWAHDCKEIVADVRHGFLKKLEPLGFQATRIRVVKSLEN
jgi:hypothetical protein